MSGGRQTPLRVVDQWVGSTKKATILTLSGGKPTICSREGGGGPNYRDLMLSAGQKAPSITLLDQDGNKVAFSSFAGRPVLVYFYPKADTPGCTQQSCGLRDIAKKIGDVAIVGISPDAVAKQKKFADKYDLPFPLLADTEHVVAERYGVWKEKSMYGRKYMGIERSAFLVDAKGKLQEVWYKISPKDTPANLLKAIGK